VSRDFELLRRHEPIVRYTQGEMFLPCPVERYVERCSLWAHAPQGRPEELVPVGALDIDSLEKHGAQSDGPLFMRFVEKPLGGLEYQRWRAGRPSFHSSTRLARVGLGPRFLDSLFSLSLYLRGKVPGGTAGRASMQYEEIRRDSAWVPYYGRVIHRDGYIVLHYLLFYAMNDWRSSFLGVNDHEADWEQLFIYLDDSGEEPEPIWLACAAHDYSGDELRRRWDDPDITVVEGHPVVYAGAGSHATYFKPGEYLTSVEIKLLRPFANAAQVARRIWRDVLGQGDPTAFVREVEALVHAPFIDYARGDGPSVGPGQPVEWTPVVVSDEVGWVRQYRGLWGLDTEDIFAGEQAPAGPRYTREGTVRQSWYDPLGWAGLSKVAPPSRAGAVLDERVEELSQELVEVRRRAEHEQRELRRLEIESRLRHSAGRRASGPRLNDDIARGEAELNHLEARSQEIERGISTLRRDRDRLSAGKLDDPRAHLRRSHEPMAPEAIRRGRLAEAWATVSVGLLLVTAAALIQLTTTDTVASLLLLVGGAIFIESILRGTVRSLLLNVTIVLAVVTSAILVWEFLWQLAVAGIAAIGIIILLQNLRRVRRG